MADVTVESMSPASATSGSPLTFLQAADGGTPTTASEGPGVGAAPLSPGMRWQRADESKVDSFIDRARQGLHCSLGCGGVKCKHESWEYFCQKSARQPAAIEGLNSHWVGEDIVASQRPSTSLFLKHLLVGQFKERRVTGVFNLQEKGEHSSCGPDGIYKETGYSYSGERDLMRHGVSYYEFPWPDMTAPDNDIVLRSVQVMDSHVRSKGKVLVHCHAGLGRTGLMIACYFIYARRMPSAEAVAYVRARRPGAVQTAKQTAFCRRFETYLDVLHQAFRRELSDAPVDLASFVRRQRLFLHGEDNRHFRHVPKHSHRVLCRLVSLARRDATTAALALESMTPALRPDPAEVRRLEDAVNSGDCTAADTFTAVPLLSFAALHWIRSLSVPPLDESVVAAIVSWSRSFPTGPAGGDAVALLDAHAKPALHAVLMFLSATFTIGARSPREQRFALTCIVDAFFHIRPGGGLANPATGVELTLVHDFFWRLLQESVRDAYFNVVTAAAAPFHRHAVSTIAHCSAEVIAEMDAAEAARRQQLETRRLPAAGRPASTGLLLADVDDVDT